MLLLLLYSSVGARLDGAIADRNFTGFRHLDYECLVLRVVPLVSVYVCICVVVVEHTFWCPYVAD